MELNFFVNWWYNSKSSVAMLESAAKYSSAVRCKACSFLEVICIDL